MTAILLYFKLNSYIISSNLNLLYLLKKQKLLIKLPIVPIMFNNPQNTHINDPQENAHYQAHLHAYQNYYQDAYPLYHFVNLPLPAQYNHILESKKAKLKSLAALNQKFIDRMKPEIPRQMLATSIMNKSKLRSTLKQFYREWSSQSKQKNTYYKILSIFKKYKESGKVLIPGCGLGRIVFEFVKQGYSTQGNQVSYFMLIGSDFILNCVDKRNSVQIAPFIHGCQSEPYLFDIITIPDALAYQQIPEDSDFSMVAGEFVDVYSNVPEAWDGIVTCFFLDTAKNIFEYIDVIHKILKWDGIWVNYGPLLYHYNDQINEISIQVSWQTLRKYISQKFIFLQEEIQQNTYCEHVNSTSNVKYNNIVFACRKQQKNNNS